MCALDEASGLCRGCLRTLEEIAGWRSSDDAEKARVLARIAERRRIFANILLSRKPGC